MSNEEQNVATIRALYEAYARKDPSVLFGSMAEDGQIGFVGNKQDFKFGGMWRGRRGAEQVIGHIAAQFEWLTYGCRELIAQGDRVVALTSGRIKDRKTGRAINIDLVDVIRLRDGNIVEFVEHFDSAAIRDLMAPMPAKARTKPAAKAKPKAKAKGKQARPKATPRRGVKRK